MCALQIHHWYEAEGFFFFFFPACWKEYNRGDKQIKISPEAISIFAIRQGKHPMSHSTYKLHMSFAFGSAWHFEVGLVNSLNENMSQHQQHCTLK